MAQIGGSWHHCTCSSPLHLLLAIAPAQESHDILVLATSSLVVAALIPLIPSYLEDYIKELMDIFYRLATIRSMHMFGKGHKTTCMAQFSYLFPTESVPSQLHTHMDVAVYYLFIQLYSLFPINLVHSLKQKAQLPQHRQNFQEYIAVSFSTHHTLYPFPTPSIPSSLTTPSLPHTPHPLSLPHSPHPLSLSHTLYLFPTHHILYLFPTHHTLYLFPTHHTSSLSSDMFISTHIWSLVLGWPMRPARRGRILHIGRFLLVLILILLPILLFFLLPLPFSSSSLTCQVVFS